MKTQISSKLDVKKILIPLKKNQINYSGKKGKLWQIIPVKSANFNKES